MFVAKLIDPRNGAIHVPTVDIDKDGKPDFVALLAQQHESVIAFVNRGKGLEFTPKTIYEAPHPNWGSSGIDLVDLDKDGDMDVLLTHGDTFDDFVLKPYHGVIWLENTGTFPFVEHRLATLPGAQRAQAADLDGDGDLDIVASAFVSGEAAPKLASLVWLEQTAPRPLRTAHARGRLAAARHARSRRRRRRRQAGHRHRLVRAGAWPRRLGRRLAERTKIAKPPQATAFAEAPEPAAGRRAGAPGPRRSAPGRVPASDRRRPCD